MIPVKNSCLNKLQQCTPNTVDAKVFQKDLFTSVSQRFDWIETNKVTTVACILDPRFKEAFYKSERNVNSAIYDLKQRYASRH
jgi:hypothetical protein